MTDAAARARLRRARAAAGLVVLPVEVDLFRVADALIEAGYLAEWDDGERCAITAALGHAIADWIGRERTSTGGNPPFRHA